MVQKHKIITFILLSSLLISCWSNPYEKQLRELDRELYSMDKRVDAAKADISDRYEMLSNAWTDSMAWEAAYSLFDNYCLRNTDSAMVYLQRMFDIYWDPELVFRNKVCRARLYAHTNHSKLEGMMAEIMDCGVSEDFLQRYYYMLIDIYSRCPELSTYSSHYIDFIESAIEYGAYSEDVLSYFKGLRSVAYNNVGEAIEYFNKGYKLTENEILKGLSAEYLADIYHDMLNDQLEKVWLISSSIHQLASLQGEQTALYRLALILSEEGDYDRAANYMKTVIERASISGFPELVVGTARGSLAVNSTLDKIDRKRQTVLVIAFLGAVIALVIILLMLVKDKRKSQVILKTKESLLKSNEQLTDANKIKDGYLIRYMNLCVSYLGMVEDSRRNIRRKMKEGGVEALMAELRRTSTTIDEYREFYKTFDNVFLGLYPEFVSQVNLCFEPEEQFKENGKLSTPLRILALIRLGFTESGDIARFLNCSPQTIYSQRSKLKAKAICSDLEERVKCIGR